MSVSPSKAAKDQYRALPSAKAPGLVQAYRWLFGHFRFWNDNAEKYGPIYRARIPVILGKVAVFTSPEAVKTVFRLKPSVAHAGEAYKITKEGAGPTSVLLLDEEPHLRMRKLMLAPLHGDRLSRWEGYLEQLTHEDIATWPVGEPFRVRPHTEQLSLAVIMKLVFGVRDPVRRDEIAKLLPILFGGEGIAASLGFLHPLGRIDLGPKSPWGRFRRKRDRLDALILAEVADRRAELARQEGSDDDEAHSDFLSILLQQRDDQGKGLTDRELRDQLATALVAGHETTSTSSAWAIERLSRHPEVVEKLRADLAAGSIVYLDAVIKETMRCRPVISQIARRLMEDTEIDGKLMPAGMTVVVPMTALHQNEDIYPDPEAFRPERFLDGNDPGNFAWLPFGGGVRRCPGASLAQLEMRVMLRIIVTSLDFVADMPDRPEKPVSFGIAVVPSRGGRIIVTGRRTPSESKRVAATG